MPVVDGRLASIFAAANIEVSITDELLAKIDAESGATAATNFVRSWPKAAAALNGEFR